MAVAPEYQADVEAILSHIGDQGGEYWTTPDKRLLKGAPFSTLECVSYLLELGMEPDAPLLREVAALIFSAWREDGRFRLYPKGAVFPCQTANAARVLCRMGYAADERLQTTFRHLLEIQHTDGGWRCEKFFFGRGPETECSNPYPTLMALDAFRYWEGYAQEPKLGRAVEFLLGHWIVCRPIGPCHYGIGTRFLQVEYPFRNYNLFEYVYVLSFYPAARTDARFLDALNLLESKTVDGKIVVERVVPRLRELRFCKKGMPSACATARYREILGNLGRV
jgi:hypothetical protein